MHRSLARLAPVVAVLAATAVVAAACGSDGSSSTATSTSTPTTAVTTTVPEATTTLPFQQPQPAEAVWPFADRAQRFDDPVGAARSFAVDYLGFVDPVMGAFQAGDSRSGEVPVRPRADGPVTTVLVRQLTSDDTWWVLGATTPNVQLSSPAALATVTSPVTLAGQSTAFEATVNVEVRQDRETAPLATDVVMGGSMGEMGPFSKAVSFPAPSAGAGAIVLSTRSAEDGQLWEASVVRVAFG